MRLPITTNTRGTAVRLLASLGAVLAVLVVSQPAAEAHVVAKATTAPDGTSTVTFTFYHGCGTSLPTTSLKVKLPEGTTNITAQNPAGFTSATDGTEVTWSGGSVPYSQQADFVASMRLVGQQGETIFLPTVQACTGGDEPWIEKTADPEAPAAAPRVVLTQTVAPETTTTTGVPASTTSAPGASSSTRATTPGSAGTGAPTTTTSVGSPASSSTNSAGAVVFFVVVAIIVLGAALIIWRRPNRPRRTPASDRDE